MEALAKRWAHKVAFELNYDNEKEQVVAYGMIALVQILVTTVIVAVLGLLLQVPLQALLLCFAVSLLRKYSGGAHLDTLEACTIMSVLISLLFALIATHVLAVFIPIPGFFVAIAVTYIIAFLLSLKKAPVDNPNKPIRTEAKRVRMKRYTLWVLGLYAVISVVLFVFREQAVLFSALNYSLLLAVLWQMMTLTGFGKAFFARIDKLNNILGK